MASDGHGARITFEDSAFTANLLSIDGPSQTRESIDATHMGSVTKMEFIPADLSDPGEYSIEFEFDSALEPPIDAAAETVTVAWGDTSATSWSATGFMTAYSGSAAIGERMTASATLKLSGTITGPS